ncbi:Uncharacterised protein [Edwardsiella hoshinae]|uniref:Uncharacterized protein n=1 Tax=Edwardsiella hoshinae TaxID=93378 RepID=A0A376DG83_9GAMM|nr:Uncharacterised protein [Edwardsiella hoshinae]
MTEGRHESPFFMLTISRCLTRYPHAVAKGSPFYATAAGEEKALPSPVTHREQADSATAISYLTSICACGSLTLRSSDGVEYADLLYQHNGKNFIP